MTNSTRATTAEQQQYSPQLRHTEAAHPATRERGLEETRARLDIESRAHQAYQAMHGGVTGLGTEEEKLAKALEGLTPEQLATLRKSYRERYGRDLDADVQSELSGDDLLRTQRLLKGDGAAAAAVALHQAMDGMGTDEEAVYSILRGKTPEQLAEIRASYKQLYNRELDTDLKSELSVSEFDRARAIEENHLSDEAALRIHDAIAGLGTDEDAVFSVLEGKSTAEIEEIKAAYRRRYGGDLEADLRGELSGTDLDRVIASLSGDNAAASAAQLREAMQGLGTDEEKISAVLAQKTDEERVATVTAYRRLYGRDLETDLQSEMQGIELECATDLLHHGRASDAQRLRLAMDRAGTDENAIREILQGKSRQEIEAIKAEYRERYGVELDADIRSELSGRDLYQANLALRGSTDDVEEQLNRLIEEQQFETSGVGGAIVGAITSGDDRLEKSIKEAQTYLKQAKGDGELTQAEKDHLRILLARARGDIDSYVEIKDTVADTAATVGATALAAGAVIVTAGAALPVVVGVAAAAGGAGYAGGKALIEGQAYDMQGVAADVAIGAVDGAVTGLTAGAGKAAVEAAKRAGKQAIQEGVEVAAKNAAREGVEHSGNRTIRFIGTHAKEGALSGAAGDATSVATDDATWEKGVAHGALATIAAAARGAAAGIVGDSMGGAATHAVTKVYESLGGVCRALRDDVHPLTPRGKEVHFTVRGREGHMIVSHNGAVAYVDSPETLQRIFVQEKLDTLQQTVPNFRATPEVVAAIEAQSKGVQAMFAHRHGTMIVPRFTGTTQSEKVWYGAMLHHEHIHSQGGDEVAAWLGTDAYLRRNGYIFEVERGAISIRKVTADDPRLAEPADGLLETVEQRYGNNWDDNHTALPAMRNILGPSPLADRLRDMPIELELRIEQLAARRVELPAELSKEIETYLGNLGRQGDIALYERIELEIFTNLEQGNVADILKRVHKTQNTARTAIRAIEEATPNINPDYAFSHSTEARAEFIRRYGRLSLGEQQQMFQQMVGSLDDRECRRLVGNATPLRPPPDARVSHDTFMAQGSKGNVPCMTVEWSGNKFNGEAITYEIRYHPAHSYNPPRGFQAAVKRTWTDSGNRLRVDELLYLSEDEYLAMVRRNPSWADTIIPDGSGNYWVPARIRDAARDIQGGRPPAFQIEMSSRDVELLLSRSHFDHTPEIRTRTGALGYV